MAFRTAPFPAQDRIVDQHGRPTAVLVNWQQDQSGDVDAAPFVFPLLERRDLAAALPITSLPLGALASGLYRVSYLLRCTQPATTSSSAALTLTWTDRSQVVSVTDAAVTGNTVSSVASRSWLIRIDQASPVTVSMAYASVGGTAAQFDLSVIVEQVQA